MKYLEFYEKCCAPGGMYNIGNPPVLDGCVSGLCDYFTINIDPKKYDPLFELMIPTSKDLDNLRSQGKNSWTWGSDCHGNKFGEFTPLRQNIVLFMAAMAGEL